MTLAVLAFARHLLLVAGLISFFATRVPAQSLGPEVPVTAASILHHNEPGLAVSGDAAVGVWLASRPGGYGIGWGFSLDGGLSWADVSQLPPATPPGVGILQPTICADHAGNFYAAAIAITPASGYSIATWRGAFQNSSFVWQPGNLLVPAAYDAGRPYDRPWVACDPDRGYLYLTYTHTQRSAVGFFPNGHQMTIHFMRSPDRGATWSVPQALSGVASNGSQLAVGPDGELYVVWEDFATQQVVGRKSMDFGVSFGPPFVVGPILDNLATPPLGWSSGQDRFNPLYPPVDEIAAPNFPALAVDLTHGAHRGSVYVAWSDYASGTVDPATGTEYDPDDSGYFVNAAPFTVGEDLQGFLHSSTPGPQTCNMYTFLAPAGMTMQISGELDYVAGSPTRPATADYHLWCGADTTQLVQVAVVPYLEPYAGSLPPLIYTFPISGRYYLDLGCGGPTDLGYLLHTRVLHIAPGQPSRDFRDVVLVSSSDGGASWSPKRRVNDDLSGFDNAMPSVAVDGLGQVQVAWYDRRDDPTCNERVRTYWTESLDGGVTFAPNRQLSSEGGSWSFNIQRLPNIGDHLAVGASGDRAWVLWTDTRAVPSGSLPSIYGRTINTEVPTAVATWGFRAEPRDAGLVLSWTVGDASGITGFRLHRSVGDGDYQPLKPGWLPAHGSGDYFEQDASVVPGGHYLYRLEVAYGDGASTWVGPIEARVSFAEARLAWGLTDPNPFVRSISLTLAVPRPGTGEVTVFDLLGHRVATLWRGPMSAGLQTLVWDGHDQLGRPAATGVYLLRASVDGERVARRIVRTR